MCIWVQIFKNANVPYVLSAKLLKGNVIADNSIVNILIKSESNLKFISLILVFTRADIMVFSFQAERLTIR